MVDRLGSLSDAWSLRAVAVAVLFALGARSLVSQPVDLGSIESVRVVEATRTVKVGGIDAVPAFAWQEERLIKLVSGPDDELFLLDRSARRVRSTGPRSRLGRPPAPDLRAHRARSG
jgi:hypothetical protein